MFLSRDRRRKCGFSSKDKEKSVKLIPLLNCTNNIYKHISLHLPLLMCRMKLSSFSQERVSLHPCKTLINSRYVLTIGRHLVWKRSSTRCTIPALLSSHSAKTKDRPRAERGLTKVASQTVLNQTGLFIPVGSGEFS